MDFMLDCTAVVITDVSLTETVRMWVLQICSELQRINAFNNLQTWRRRETLTMQMSLKWGAYFIII